MNKAECAERHIPWPLGECISGSGDFVPHPNEERFDFPCSQTYRDFYMDTFGTERESLSSPLASPLLSKREINKNQSTTVEATPDMPNSVGEHSRTREGRDKSVTSTRQIGRTRDDA